MNFENRKSVQVILEDFRVVFSKGESRLSPLPLRVSSNGKAVEVISLSSGAPSKTYTAHITAEGDNLKELGNTDSTIELIFKVAGFEEIRKALLHWTDKCPSDDDPR